MCQESRPQTCQNLIYSNKDKKTAILLVALNNICEIDLPPKPESFNKKFNPTWPKYNSSGQLLLHLASVSSSHVHPTSSKSRAGCSVRPWPFHKRPIRITPLSSKTWASFFMVTVVYVPWVKRNVPLPLWLCHNSPDGHAISLTASFQPFFLLN